MDLSAHLTAAKRRNRSAIRGFKVHTSLRQSAEVEAKLELISITGSVAQRIIFLITLHDSCGVDLFSDYLT